MEEGCDDPYQRVLAGVDYEAWKRECFGFWPPEVDIRDLFPSVPLEECDDDCRRIWLDDPGGLLPGSGRG